MARARLLLVGMGVVVFALLGVSVASAFACTETWTGAGGDGMWTTAANWSPQAIPGNGNTPDVCLPDIGHSYTVTLAPFAAGGGYTVNSLTIGTPTGSDTETLQIVGESYVYEGETQNGEGLGETAGATINATGSLVLDATAGGAKMLSGDTLGGPASFGDPSNGGPTIFNYGQIMGETSDPAWGENLNANITNEPGGHVDVTSGSLDQQTGGTLTNDGTVDVAAGADYRVTSAGTNDDFVNAGTLTNTGTFETQGQTGTFTQSGTVTGNPVSIDSANLADQSGGGAFTIENLGYGTPTLTGTIPAGQTVTVNGTSFVSGGETTNGTGLNLNGTTVTNDGTLVLDATADGAKALASDTLGGGVGVFDGSLTNNGTLAFRAADPAWGNKLEVTLENGKSGGMSVSGDLSQDVNVATTNDGTVTLTPSGLYTVQSGSFINASDGTLIPQIASATSLGAVQLQSPGTFTAGGTVAPSLIGGYTPTAEAEFPIVALKGGTFSGTFASVRSPFTANYTKESASPATVDVVYGHLSPTGARGVAKLGASAVVSTHGVAALALSCTGASHAICAGRITLSAKVKTKIRRRVHGHLRTVTVTKTVVLGSAPYNLTAGTATTSKITLTRAAAKQLARAASHRLRVTATVAPRAGAHATRTVTLIGPTSRRRAAG